MKYQHMRNKTECTNELDGWSIRVSTEYLAGKSTLPSLMVQGFLANQIPRDWTVAQF